MANQQVLLSRKLSRTNWLTVYVMASNSSHGIELLKH